MLFAVSLSYGQTTSETVFITKSDPNEKVVGDQHTFTQFTLSVPLRGNPEADEIEDIKNEYASRGEQYEPTVLDYVLPNGLSAHGGYGLHFRSWIGISANAGIDWIATEKIVSAPVYGSIVFNPQIWDETSVYLQAGYGRAFALGRGSLSGEYYKYRIGLGNDNDVSLFIDLSRNKFALHDLKEINVISIGISIFDFL